MGKIMIRSYRKRIILILFLIGALIAAAAPLLADCQFCWTASGDEGQCQDVLDGDLLTLNNCQGISRCWVFFGGQICFPACTGQQCFIV